jgi:hypothetical protein
VELKEERKNLEEKKKLLVATYRLTAKDIGTVREMPRDSKPCVPCVP